MASTIFIPPHAVTSALASSSEFEGPPEHKIKKVSAKQFRTPSEVMAVVLETGVNKSRMSIDQLVILGFLAGLYIAIGGIFSQIISLGVPGIKADNPGIPKLLVAVTFPVALMIIIIAGGELFTGNVMFFMVAVADNKVSVKDLLRNWFFVYFSNYAGAVAGAYFYGYLTQVFSSDPWLSGIQAIAVAKTEYDFGVVFLKGIAANQVVNLAIVFCIASQDVISKIFSSWFVIGIFAAIGYEHCVANMYNLSISLMYGSDVGYGYTIYRNLIPTTLGNIVGGGILVGMSQWYAYLYQGRREHGNVTKDEVETAHAIADARGIPISKVATITRKGGLTRQLGVSSSSHSNIVPPSPAPPLASAV